MTRGKHVRHPVAALKIKLLSQKVESCGRSKAKPQNGEG